MPNSTTPQPVPYTIIENLQDRRILETIDRPGVSRGVSALFNKEGVIQGFFVSRENFDANPITNARMSVGNIEFFFFERLAEAYPFFKEGVADLPLAQ